MSAASDYTETNVLNAHLRGVTYPLPTGTYVSLHTAAPSEDTGSNEVSTANWPSYVRVHAEQGGAIGTGWSAPATDGTGKVSRNAKQLTWPNNNGVNPVVVTHAGIWDAVSGGNLMDIITLTTPKTINPLDVHVFDINSLTVKMS